MQNIAQVVSQKKIQQNYSISYRIRVSYQMKLKYKLYKKNYKNLFRPSKSLYKFGAKLIFFNELVILVYAKDCSQVVSENKIHTTKLFDFLSHSRIVANEIKIQTAQTKL